MDKQELFNYLSNELGVTALESQMQDIERIVLGKQSNEIAEQITDLSKRVNEGNRLRGFWDDWRARQNEAVERAYISQMIMLVVTELSEAVEGLRKDKRMKEYDRLEFEKWKEKGVFTTKFEEHIKDTFEDEIADAVIRLLDLSGGLGIDIGFHIVQKLMYNDTRPYKHGKNF